MVLILSLDYYKKISKIDEKIFDKNWNWNLDKYTLCVFYFLKILDMKRLFLIIFLVIGFTCSYAWQNQYFNIVSSGAYQPWNTIKLTVSDKIPNNIQDIQLYVGDTKLLRLGNSWYPNYLFKITSPLNVNNRYLKIHIDYQNKTNQDFVYQNVKIPYFSDIDAVDARWWGKVKINLSTSLWNCYLFADNKQWSVSGTGDEKYVNIPTRLDNDVNGGYVICSDLASNYVKFFIPSSPDLIYAVSKDKSSIYPGSTLIVKWKYIRLSPNDNIKVYLGSKEIRAKFLDNDTFEITLPKQNIDTTLKVVRNGFESNTLKIKASDVPVIYNVTTENTSNWVFFDIYGRFDFSLWSPVVNYNWQNLKVLLYKNISPNMQLIKVQFPLPKLQGNDFSCSVNLKPGNLYVSVWNVKSNAYYFNPDIDYQITKIDYPKCNQGVCTYRVYVNKNLPNMLHVYLNWNRIDNVIHSYNVITFTMNNLVKKANLQLEFPDCTLSQTYSFDFTKYFQPKITSIYSRQHFIPNWEFEIQWEKITNDGFHTNMGVNLKLNPNVLLNNKFIVKYTTVNWTISALANKWQLVKVSLSNVNWNSNGWYFIIWWDKSYLWNPIIENVLYPNGWFAGDKLIIKWYNFSDNCADDMVYLWNQVFYPDSCDFNELDMKIPQWITFNTIKIVRKDDNYKASSLEYKLNTTLWGMKTFDKFQFIGLNEGQYVNVNKDNKVNLNFKIYNPITDIFVPELKFKVITNEKILPISNITLAINGNDYQYSFVWDKIYKTDSKLVWFVRKWTDGYEIVFKNVFIPFFANSINASLSFEIDNSVANWQDIEIYSPSEFYYYNVFGSEVAKLIKLRTSKIGKIVVQNLANKCFDSDPSNANCALVLKWKWKQTIIKKYNQSSKTYSNKVKKTYENKVASNRMSNNKLTREQRIANKLTLQKMKLLNNILRKYIYIWKTEYRGNKEKMKYIIEMYRGYKQMVQNTSDEYDKKIKYVQWLIYFAKNYFAFIRNK